MCCYLGLMTAAYWFILMNQSMRKYRNLRKIMIFTISIGLQMKNGTKKFNLKEQILFFFVSSSSLSNDMMTTIRVVGWNQQLFSLQHQIVIIVVVVKLVVVDCCCFVVSDRIIKEEENSWGGKCKWVFLLLLLREMNK